MTLRDDLKKQLEKDYQRAPRIFFNSNGLEMIWNNSENLYTAKDSNGKEWIAALQNSKVPIFFVSCTHKIQKNNQEVNCGAINVVPIFNNDKEIKCRTCSMEFTVKITVPESSVAYDISQNLDK